MQSPEVYNFPTPDSLFSIETFEGRLPLNNSTINNFHYNHLVSIIIPKDIGESEVTNHINTDIFYKIYDLNLQELTDVTFISSFIRNGKLNLISINERIDCDNCIGITVNGKLCLNLNKNTYQSFGIEGVSSDFTKKLGNRYIVNVDLTDVNLLNNQSKLNKLKTCLQTLNKFTVLMSWEPPDEEICPSSIAKFFADLGYKVQQCSSSFSSCTVHTKMPVPNIKNGDKYDMLEFVEWLGMLSLACDLQPDSTNYLSSYLVDVDSSEIEQVQCLRLQGFLSPNDIKQIVKNVSKMSFNKWVAIYVQGFSDCPVTWGLEEHHYFTNGDNGYILIFNKDAGVICTHKCSRRRYK